MIEASAVLLKIFSFSFLVALTGAMSPGPLLTYTIIRSSGGRRGYLMAVPIIAGHAVVELGIMLLLFAGFSFILTNVFVMRAIGVAGGLILAGFGFFVIRDAQRDKLPGGSGLPGAQAEPDMPVLSNPVIGGAVVSMSNPYWWVWWATIGFAFMVNFDITPSATGRIAAFYLGHELGDLGWYLMVSVFSFFGIKYLNDKIYSYILVLCGVFMIFFGVYLGIKPFFCV